MQNERICSSLIYDDKYKTILRVLIFRNIMKYHLSTTCSVLENVLQRQQHRCQEILNIISRRNFSCILQEIFVIPYCHIIYFLFTKAFCKSRLSCAEIEVYHNVRLSQCGHHTSHICWKFYILHTQEIYILGFCCQERNIFSRPGPAPNLTCSSVGRASH